MLLSAAHCCSLSLKAHLQSSQAQQLASVAQTAAPAPSSSRSQAEADDDAAGMDDDAMSPAAARSSAAAAAQVAPLSALPIPALLSPEVPQLLSSLHSQLSSLRGVLEAFSPAERAVCFDHMFAGPLFTVLVSHPKAAERGAPTGAGADATMLCSAPFPMLPHQDRVWEACLLCLHSLLSAGLHAPVTLRSGSFPKRFFLLFQQLLHFLPSDFKTVSSGPAAGSTANVKLSSSADAAPKVAVWHSEETRIAAMQCVHDLFLCCEQILLLSANATPAAAVLAAPFLAPLLKTLQRDPSFCVSLGYYIHLMLRFASKERNRQLRALAVESLSTLVRVLQSPVLNEATPSAGAAPAVPGRMLLLSYFPGMMSSLYHLLLFDSGSASRAAGWRLQLSAFELFVELTRATVRQISTVESIVREAVSAAAEQDAPKPVDTEMEARDENALAADETVAKLRALLPKSSGSEIAAKRPAVSSAPATTSPSQLHPLLQSILKPVDVAWWTEARKNIANIMSRVFAPTTLLATKTPLALAMLAAAESFLLGSKDDLAIGQQGESLFARGHSIYTALLPPSVVGSWMEFIISCHEHDDPTLARRAEEIVNKIGARVGTGGAGWAGAQANQKGLILAQPSPAASSSSLVPLLTSALSTHLLRLPRTLPTASEATQVALLKTIKGYFAVLARSAPASAQSGVAFVVSGPSNNPLYEFISSNWDRIFKIFYRVFAVDHRESKVLERAADESARLMQGGEEEMKAGDESHAVVPAAASSSSALALPTYYSFSFLSLSPASSSVALSLLRSLGRDTASHFGLLLGMLHERLRMGVAQIEQGNFLPSNEVKETLLFINCFVAGMGEALRAGHIDAYEVLPHVELLLLDYIAPTLWHVPLFNSPRRGEGTQALLLSQQALANNALIVVFLLRGIGDMAQALGVHARSFLMHLLYPLLEKLGSPRPEVRQAAWVTLHRLAQGCGYAEEASWDRSPNEEGPLTPDAILQAMLVANMDYLVEQMAVELRSLSLGPAPSIQATGADSRAHPLTLPLVLSSLLTRMSLSCTQAIIPLLDDILKLVLDKLGELSVTQGYDDETDEGEGGVSTSMGRLAYLEILRAVVTAIHLIQKSKHGNAPVEPRDPEALYASAPPLPLIPAESNAPALLKQPETPALMADVSDTFDPDSMLNFESDLIEQSKPAVEEEKKSLPAPAPVDVAPTEPKEALQFFAPQSIRNRLQATLELKAKQAADDRYEAEWLRRSRGGNGASSSMEVDDVPRDAEGKTSAERWYEEQQLLRAKQESQKFNTINGIPDPEADEALEVEAQAHKAKDPEEIPLTPDQETVLRVFSCLRNFLSTATSVSQRYSVLATVEECIPVLAAVPKQFFPELAKFWPSLLQGLKLMENTRKAQSHAAGNIAAASMPLMLGLDSQGGGGFSNSLVAESSSSAMQSLTSVRVQEDGSVSESDRQLTQLISSLSAASASTAAASSLTPSNTTFTHSNASPLFIQSLQVLSLLAGTASKFLSGRFAQELWPVLQQIMEFERKWMGEITAQRKAMRNKRGKQQVGPAELAAEEATLQLLPAYKVQHALLVTLSHLVRFPDLSSVHVRSFCERVRAHLSSEAPAEFQKLAKGIMLSLAQLDCDAVWTSLWEICPHVAVESHEQRRKQRGGGHAALSDPTAENASFLSHPCFAQVFPNFDARFLLHARMQVIPPTAQPLGREFEENVRAVLEAMKTLPEPKLGL